MADKDESSKDWFNEALNVESARKFERQVFTIMPFTVANGRGRAELDDFYQKVLKEPLESPAWNDFSLRISRSETKLRITDEIIQDLAAADYVIADLSGSPPNPNVMYELGVRLSLSTAPVILIRENHPANQVLFDVSTLHTFHYDLNNLAALIAYLTDKIRAFEAAEERYISPVLQCVQSGESVFHAAERGKAARRLELLEREIGAIVELYGNVVTKALETVGRSTEEVLEVIEQEDTPLGVLASDERYAAADTKGGTALSVPTYRLPSASDLDDILCRVLPRKVCDQVFECLASFQSRFFMSHSQWAMDGPIAASLQFVRAAILLSCVLSGARKLVEMAFDGPVDLDAQRRGWIAADHLQFVHDYGEFLSDENRFRGRLLRWVSSEHHDGGLALAKPRRKKIKRP